MQCRLHFNHAIIAANREFVEMFGRVKYEACERCGDGSFTLVGRSTSAVMNWGEPPDTRCDKPRTISAGNFDVAQIASMS